MSEKGPIIFGQNLKTPIIVVRRLLQCVKSYSIMNDTLMKIQPYCVDMESPCVCSCARDTTIDPFPMFFAMATPSSVTGNVIRIVYPKSTQEILRTTLPLSTGSIVCFRFMIC